LISISAKRDLPTNHKQSPRRDFVPRIKFCSPEYDAAYSAETDPAKKLDIATAGIMMHRPQAAKLVGELVAVIKHKGTISQRLAEMLRLRIAFHNQCRSCMAMRFQEAIDDGLTDDLVCSLEKPEESPDLTAAERAALKYADLFATNHLAINESVYDGLRQHFTESELVDIGLICGMYVGMGRLMASLLMTDALPEKLMGPASTEKKYVPWGVEGLVFEPLADPV
jgi:alkylhydroperoxidase family enzyme